MPRRSKIHRNHQTKKKKKRNKKKLKAKTFKKLKCSPVSNSKGKKYTCYTSEALYKIKEAWNLRHPDAIIYSNKPREIWEHLKELNSAYCSNEMCWLKQQCIKHDLDPNLILENFAPVVPRKWLKKSDEWLSSVDIIKVMKQWEKKEPKFLFLGPSPVDYDEKLLYNECVWEDLCKFSLTNTIKKGKRLIGIIFNTDPHTEDGEHWICVFIHVPKKEVYFFDSYADKPPKRVRKFIKTIEEQSTQIGNKYKYICNTTRHQYSNSECGMYCLYIIVQLLNGKNWEELVQNKIPDKNMKALRKQYFNHIKV